MFRRTTLVFSVIALHVVVIWVVRGQGVKSASSTAMQVQLVVPIPQQLSQPSPSPQPKLPPKSKVVTTPAQEPATTHVLAKVSSHPASINTAFQTHEANPNALADAPTASLNVAPSVTPPPTSSRVSTQASPAPVTPTVELPSRSADYLNNTNAPYPALSKRLGEQGKVVVRVLIGIDGQASQASVKISSGFQRLDLAAINTVLGWRYRPGVRAGVAEAMWFDVPVTWVLQ